MRDLVVEAGRDLVLDFGPITRLDVNDDPVAVDLSLADTKLWFTVKASIFDDYSAAKVHKTYIAGGASDGFTLTSMSSLTIPNGYITVGDGEVIVDAPELWVWDLTLEEPSGRRETIDRGAFKVRLPVTDAA